MWVIKHSKKRGGQMGTFQTYNLVGLKKDQVECQEINKQTNKLPGAVAHFL
jgi:hypothetical protein